MKAVIMAAGKSTRAYPLTLTKPKPLLKIANKTILEHNLEQLAGVVDEAIIIAGYHKEMIMKFLGESFNGIKITYVEQKEQKGTGHALQQAEPVMKERFILINGDDLYSRLDIENCLKHDYCILSREVRDPRKFGVLVLDGNYLKDIIEKPKDIKISMINTGLYVLDTEIFKELKKMKPSERGEYELTDAVKSLAKRKKIFCETVRGFWFSLTYPWYMLEANEHFLSKLDKSETKGTLEPNVSIKGNVIIGEGSLIRNGTYIEGPVIIGKNCKIGPNCYIRPSTSIGDNCKVGNACEIENSILMGNVSIGHLSYFGDSILGENINIGAGTMVANLRHDNQNIKSLVAGKLTDTERRKFGTVIGDNVHTGISTLIYPGRKIWPNKTTLPGEIVKEDKSDF